MPLMGGMTIGAGLISGLMANQGAQTQADAYRYAANLQHQQYLQNAQTLQPFIGAGGGAAGTLASFLGVNGQGAQGNALNNYSSGPFMNQWVNTANRNTALAASAQGGGLSGNVLSALYNQNAGMWQNQYNQYLAQLAGLSGQGAGAAGALAGVGTQAAATQGGMIGQAGQAAGAGIMGMGSALGGGLNNAGIYALLGRNQNQNTVNGQSTSLSDYGGINYQDPVAGINFGAA